MYCFSKAGRPSVCKSLKVQYFQHLGTVSEISKQLISMYARKSTNRDLFEGGILGLASPQIKL